MKPACPKPTRSFYLAGKLLGALLMGWVCCNHALAGGGDFDLTFPSVGFLNGPVLSLTLQPDGKLIVGGGFTAGHSRIARLKSDGALDPDFDPGLGADGNVWTTSLQPDGKIIMGGEFEHVNGTNRNYCARLNTNGSLDAAFSPPLILPSGPPPTNIAFATVYTTAIQADGKIIVGGPFGIARWNAVSGSGDSPFNTAIGTGPDESVFACALQTDGRILIGGVFTNYNGTAANHIARLNSTGVIDPSFLSGTGANDWIYAVALQPDGKILIGGAFTSYNGTPVNRVARLLPNGSLDPTFNPGTGPDDKVRAIAIQSDGKVIIGGAFASYNGTAREHVARLGLNGALDGTFNVGSGANNNPVETTVVQPDGKIIIGGGFTILTTNNYLFPFIARLLPAPGAISFNTASNSVGEGAGSATITLTRTGGTDNRIAAKVTLADITTAPADYIGRPGQIDTSFNPAGATSGFGANIPKTTVLQPDGKVILGGWYFNYGDDYREGLVRLKADGSFDPSFDAGYTSGEGVVMATVLQPDGKLIAGGSFTGFNGETRYFIARLMSDGLIDDTFDSGSVASQPVRALALQPDGKLLVGGDYLTLANNPNRNSIARLNADGSLDPLFAPNLIGPGPVTTIVVQPDGKIIIAGEFINYYDYDLGAFVPLRFIARLNSNGSLDPSFNPGTAANGVVTCVALQPDSKIVLGGYFNQFNGATNNYFARLNSDGSLDSSFNTGTGPLGYPEEVALQPDGKIILVGDFTSYNGVERETIARVNTNGSLDMAFDPGVGPNSGLDTLSLQPDGRILVGGGIVNFSGFSRRGIARIANGDFFVTWPAGDSADKTVQLPIINDLLLEADETLSLGITLLSGGATLGAHPTSILTIIDNDGGSNVRPVVNSQSISTSQDTTKAITLTAADANGDLLSYIVTTNPVHGYLTGVPPNLRYFPDYGYVGGDSFTFKANDGQLDSTNPAIVSITVNSTFAQWQQQNFTPLQLNNPAISGDTADPDGDGIVNLLEYAFHLDPNQPLVANLPKPFLAANYFAMIYTRAVGATDLTFTLEQSFDLINWTPVVPMNVILADDGVTQTIKAEVPLNGALKTYLRLAVAR